MDIINLILRILIIIINNQTSKQKIKIDLFFLGKTI